MPLISAGGGGTPTALGSMTSVTAMTPAGVRVPSKLAQRIWAGQFVDMAELLPEKLGQPEQVDQEDKEARKRRRKRIVSALQWIECFHSYIGLVAQQQPARVADLLAYASLIVHAARKFKGEAWLQYDANFRKFAEAHPGTRWAEVNTSLWTLAFCNAQPRPHCELCFSIDHETQQCEDYVQSPTEQAKKRGQAAEQSPRPKAEVGKAPICINWNRRSCQSPTCTFQHICLECHQRHRERDCPVASAGAPRNKRRRDQEEEDKPPFRRKGLPPR